MAAGKPACKACERNRVKRVRNEIRLFIDSFKARPCADCGKTYPPWVMDFDHRSGKDFDIAGAIGKCLSKERIRAEIEKCDVVCSNCHRQRSHDRAA
jgi:hypothetical protein